MAKRYVLTTDGLSMTPDDFVTPASQVQAFVGGKALRKLAGVASDAGIAAYVSPATWAYTFDFTDSDGGFTAVADGVGHDVGVYTEGVGWEDVLHQDGPNRYRNIVIAKTMGIATTLTDITVNYSMTTGVRDAADEVNGFARYDGIYEHLYSNDYNDATPNPMAWSGSESFAVDDELRVYLNCGLDNAGDPGGTAAITSIVIAGTGENPFGIGELITSTDSGTSIDTIEIAGSGFPANGCFDADDSDAGVIVVGNGVGIHYANSYAAASTSELTGLTGLDGAAKVVLIRVPFLKLATQAANDTATSMQFIYGVDAAVSGKTLWGITFNASTGAIAAQSDMTPVIGGTTYYVIGANALETYGGNTQRIAALCKPVGGGNTHVLSSTNGGGSWTDHGEYDYTRLHFVTPAAGGNGSVITLAGGSGVGVSVNLGDTVQDKIGDFVAELSSSDPLGAFIY